MKITKTRALEIYSAINPKDDVREVPTERNDRCRRDSIAMEVQDVCAAPSLDKAVEVVAWWPITELRKAVKRMRAMGRKRR